MPQSSYARCPRSRRWSHRKNDSRSYRGMRNRKGEAFCFHKTAFSKTRPCDSPDERFRRRTPRPRNAPIRDSWAGGCMQPPCNPTAARETGDARRTGRGKARHADKVSSQQPPPPISPHTWRTASTWQGVPVKRTGRPEERSALTMAIVEPISLWEYFDPMQRSHFSSVSHRI